MKEVIEKLKSVLPLELYGVGTAKPFSILAQEIENGECQIVWKSDQPIRILNVARVDVRHKSMWSASPMTQNISWA